MARRNITSYTITSVAVPPAIIESDPVDIIRWDMPDGLVVSDPNNDVTIDVYLYLSRALRAGESLLYSDITIDGVAGASINQKIKDENGMNTMEDNPKIDNDNLPTGTLTDSRYHIQVTIPPNSTGVLQLSL